VLLKNQENVGLEELNVSLMSRARTRTRDHKLKGRYPKSGQQVASGFFLKEANRLWRLIK
jgi:hypothetical protein